MESHIIQYTPGIPITVQINDLDANSFIRYSESGVNKTYEAKGIVVNKMSAEADTNYAFIQRDESGRIIKSSSRTLPNQLPFEYFANSTLDPSTTMMEAIDKKMINGLLGMTFGVYCFLPDGTYYEPYDFSLGEDGNGMGDIYIVTLCGLSYTDMQYAIKEEDGEYGDWVDFTQSFETPWQISGLDTGKTYTVKCKSAGTTMKVYERTISI